MNRPLKDRLDDAFDADAADEVRERLQASMRARAGARRQRSARPWALAVGVTAVAAGLALAVWTGQGGGRGHTAQSAQSTQAARAAQPQTAQTTQAAFVGHGSPGPLRLGDRRALPTSQTTRTEPVRIALDDGSTLDLAPRTSLIVNENSASRIGFGLSSGRVLFDVRPHGPRRWTIDAELALVEVLGTRFSVEREDGFAAVKVERGHVRVRAKGAGSEEPWRDLWPGQSLRVAQNGVMAMTEETVAPEGEAATGRDEQGTDLEEEAAIRAERATLELETAARVGRSGADAPSVASGSTALVRASTSTPVVGTRDAHAVDAERSTGLATPRAGAAAAWRDLVRRGSYGQAFAHLESVGFEREVSRARDAETLFALADAARLSGHTREALAPLTEIEELGRRDRRASLAAFTLGRLYAESLDDPRQGASHFARALELGLPPSLEEAVYVRWVEALGQAGETARAHAAATAYDARFPEGRMRARVARWLPQ